MHYLQPLAIVVVWHPDFTAGATLANAIFKQFCRDFAHPSARGVGIPVFFRSLPPIGVDKPAPPLEIDLDDASQTLVVAFVESNMVNADDWDTYLGKIAAGVSKPGAMHRLFPVTVSGTPLGIHKAVDVLNCIRLSEEVIPAGGNHEQILQQKTKELLFLLSVEFCKAVELQADKPAEKLQVFLSHARRDGGKAAKTINNHLRTKTSIESYLDVLSIQPGKDFRTEIENGVKASSVLVWLSDAYASRDWCRKEVLFAKKHNRPIIVVNALKKQELRSFPYLGNVPTIRWKQNIEEVLSLMLLETLRFAYLKRYLDQFKSSPQIAGLIGKDVIVLPNAPELLSFKYLNQNMDQTILYPDPPLSQAEFDILDFVSTGTKMVTPAWVYAHPTKADGSKLLQGRKIGLSIGKPDQNEILRRGFSDLHQDDMVIEFVRYLLSGGARVIYGGNLKVNGYTNALIELAESYHTDDRTQSPLVNYLHWPYFRDLSDDRRARLKGTVKFELIQPDPLLPIQHDLVEPDFGAVEKLASAIAGSQSRAMMSAAEDARVCIGGKLIGYHGFYPGILEEAYNTIKAGKPLYLLGAWGGCAGAICEMLESSVMPEVFKNRTSQAAPLQLLLWQQRASWTGKISTLDKMPLGTEEMATEILQAGIAGLRNGLTHDENMQLFRAVHVPEMVGLALKGLIAYNYAR